MKDFIDTTFSDIFSDQLVLNEPKFELFDAILLRPRPLEVYNQWLTFAAFKMNEFYWVIPKKEEIHIIPPKISFEHAPRNREKLLMLLILLKYRQTSAVPVENEFYYFC